MNIEAKCKDCEAPIKLTGLIITDTHIDFSQAKFLGCTKCGCKCLSVRVMGGVLLQSMQNEEQPK
jgi:hypothetical protein